MFLTHLSCKGTTRSNTFSHALTRSQCTTHGNCVSDVTARGLAIASLQGCRGNATLLLLLLLLLLPLLLLFVLPATQHA
jgi:hypothetical protein